MIQDLHLRSKSPADRTLRADRLPDCRSSGRMDFFNSEIWEEFQRSVAETMGLYIEAFDEKGRKIGELCDEPEFCKLIKSSPKGLSRCQKSCCQCFPDALQSGKSFLFICHAGLTSVALPVICPLEECCPQDSSSSADLIRVILLGRVLLSSPEEEKLARIARDFDLPVQKVLEAAGVLGKETTSRLKLAGEIIGLIVNYLASSSLTLDFLRRQISKLTACLGIGSEAGRERTLSMILETISALFGIKECSIIIQDRGKPVFKTACSLGRGGEYLHYECNQAVIERLLETRAPLVSCDARHITEMGFGGDVESIAAFPLTFDDQVTGSLLVFNRFWTDEDLLAMSSLCSFIGTTLRNAELYDDTDQTVGGLSILAEAGREIGSIRELDQLLANILDKSKELAKAKRSSVMLVEQNQKRVTVKVAKGLPREVSEQLKSVEKGTVAYHALKQGEPVLVKDITADPRFSRSNLPHLHRQARYESGSFISLPLRLRGRSIGLINVADKITGGMFDENDLRLLASFAAQATIAIERSLYYEESERQKLLAVTDELTGLYNRRYFRERLCNEIERSGRYSHPLCLVMLDVDDFKNYNDNNGHLSGDEVLKRIAQILKATTRGVDVLCRFGGEEFALIFPETDKQVAIVIAERIRKAVEDASFKNQRAQPKGHLTVSLGVAVYPEDAGSSTDLIEKADQAMYQAKVSGKNRAAAYNDNMPVLTRMRSLPGNGQSDEVSSRTRHKV